MYRVSKRFKFSAAHKLLGLPDDHPCSEIHGHNYWVDIIVTSNELNNTGFVIDFRYLKKAIKPIINTLDHSHLVSQDDPSLTNGEYGRFHNILVLPIPNITVEHLCEWVHEQASIELPDVDITVRIWESDETYGEYRPNTECGCNHQ